MMSATLAKAPRVSVAGNHEDDDGSKADGRRNLAGFNRIRAQGGTNGSLLDDRERNRQGAGPQQQRQFLRLEHGEGAGDDTASLADRPIDARSTDDDPIENNGEQTTDILRRHIAKPRGAHAVKAEGDNRATLIETCRGTLQTFSGHENLRPQDVVLSGLFTTGHENRSDRELPGFGSGHGRILIDEMERQLGGLTEARAQHARVVDSRHLDKNSVPPLAGDDRLQNTIGINTPAQHLQGALDGIAETRLQAILGECRRDRATLIDGDREIVRQSFKFAGSSRSIVGIAQGELPVTVITSGDSDTNAFTTQRPPHIALEPCETPFPPGCLVDLQQEMCSAGKVKTETHLLVRQPGRQFVCNVT